MEKEVAEIATKNKEANEVGKAEVELDLPEYAVTMEVLLKT